MKTITMLEFRRDAEAIIRKVQQGVRMVLTHRGKPVARLEPIEPDQSIEPDELKEPDASDPFYSLCKLGESLVKPGEITKLSNEEIDRIVYDH